MTEAGYEILAMLMRYVFVLLGALIVFRAYLWLYRDHLKYQQALRDRPGAGTIGELTDEQSGKSWPLYHEGTIGSSGGCDVRIRKKGLRRSHASFRLLPGKGVAFFPARHAALSVDGVEINREGIALDHSVIRAADALLRVNLRRELGIPTRTDPIPPSPEEDEEGWMRLFADGADPGRIDPTDPLGGGFPGFPEGGADAFLPDRKDAP